MELHFDAEAQSLHNLNQKRHIVEIGGTRLTLAVLRSDCEYEITTLKTPYNYDTLVETIANTTTKMNISRDVYGREVFVATPGLVDADGSVIRALYAPVNARPLRTDLSRIMERPVIVTNDADAQAIGALSETAGGRLYITIGTGTGGAVVSNGSLVRNKNRFAGEVGHIVTTIGSAQTCACGRRGCLDTQISGAALSERLGAYWWLRDSNPDVDRSIRLAAAALAEVIISVANLLGIEGILINGHIAIRNDFQGHLSSALLADTQLNPNPIEVEYTNCSWDYIVKASKLSEELFQ
ncbi:ROK family protein [Nocardia wallacei]|uniref:ROK family protein n=1 Tax=Nocardia wallacei TaxID=480035 RepID=UPI003CC7EC87